MEIDNKLITEITLAAAKVIMELAEKEVPDDEIRGRLTDAVLAKLLTTYLDIRCPDLETKKLFLNQLMVYVLNVKETIQ